VVDAFPDALRVVGLAAGATSICWSSRSSATARSWYRCAILADVATLRARLTRRRGDRLRRGWASAVASMPSAGAVIARSSAPPASPRPRRPHGRQGASAFANKEVLSPAAT